MSSLPATIFKYEPLSLQSLKNFKAQSVFFASPLKFNDPYDCAIAAGVEEPTAEDVEALCRHYAGRADLPGPLKTLFDSGQREHIKDMFINSVRKTIDEQRAGFLKGRGVCCFSEINDHLLMWAHYGACYQGMCLEFRTNREPFNKIKEINYVDPMPKINMLRIATERDASHVLERLFCTKSRSWAYEREWRCFHAEANTLFGYPAEALKAVYFGPNIDPIMLDLVCIILACQNPDAEIWLGRRSESEFKLVFDIKEYTPYIMAKRQGRMARG